MVRAVIGLMQTSSPPAAPQTIEYRGRFAPSPTGPLHAGSLVAALASWLDARAHGGAWLIRIEDLDPPREVTGATQDILRTLAEFGMESDEPVACQSARTALYEATFGRLRERGCVYGCACTRSEVEGAAAAAGLAPGIYPGTCRQGTGGRDIRAWRYRAEGVTAFIDRAVGLQSQDLAEAVGDFVVRRADGLWAYQLAVVVDDDDQRVTDVVRGADLLDNTPRQIALQRPLGLRTPRYLHVPVVVNERGEKLSKQTGARPLDRTDTTGELERAARHLALPPIGAASVAAFQRAAVAAWAERWQIGRS
jgi:glutamyl-Q tRNA(Asp) synthetase